MASLALTARPRSVLGKKVKQLRRTGITPANIYGHNVPSVAIEADTRELNLLLRRAGRTALVEISVQGEAAPRPVLVRQYTRRPVNDQLLHVDFFQVSMRETLTVEVPVTMVGIAPVADAGDGVVMLSLETVLVECLPGDIPSHIEADLSSLVDTSVSIFVRDLRVPAGVTVMNDPDIAVVSVTSELTAEEEDQAEAEAAPDADVPTVDEDEAAAESSEED